MVEQQIPTIHYGNRVPGFEAVEQPLRDVDDEVLDPANVEERLQSIQDNVSGPSMAEQHPLAFRYDDSIPEPDGVEELLHDTDDHPLKSEIIEGRRRPMQSDGPQSLMVQRQFPAVYDDSSILNPEAFERQPHNINSSVLQSDIVERQPHVEQDTVSGGRLTDTTSLAPIHIAPVPPTAERRIVQLPLEMVGWIIGFLDNWDVVTIANCALVCRQWLPLSRFKLYHCIRLDFRRQWIAFERLMSLPASSTMAGYLGKVRHLWIEPKDTWFPGEEKTQRRIVWHNFGQHRGWTYQDLVRWGTCLSGLTRIDFDGINWSEHYHPSGLPSGSTWQSLTSLHIRRCTFADVMQLHMFVTAFPVLEDLSLDWIGLKSKTLSHIPEGGHSLTRLTLWSFNSDDMTAVLQWLARAELVKNLAYLKWWPFEADQLLTFHNGINEPSLRELELRQVPLGWPGVDLSRFTSLRVLRLRYYGWSLQRHLESVHHILSSISSDQFEELHIYLDHQSFVVSSLDSTAFSSFAQLKAIGDLLAGPRFSHLRQVAFEYDRLEITTEGVPDSLLPPSRSGVIIPVSVSSSIPDPSDQLDVAQPANAPEAGLADLQHSYRLYAEHLVLHRLRDEMKQLNARGILEIKLTVALYTQDQDTVELCKIGYER